MTDAEYMDMIKQTYGPDCDDHVLFCMVGVAGEAGEIANMAQKAMRGDFKAAHMVPPGDFHAMQLYEQEVGQRRKLIEEMGGLYYFFRALCWQLGVEPEEVMAVNAEKLRSRLKRGTIRGDGDGR